MDYRILATAEADSIHEKAEWEVQLDRVPPLQRVLQVGEICFTLALMWALWEVGMFAIHAIYPAIYLVDPPFYALDPGLSLEDASLYLQYFSLLAAIIVMLIKMAEMEDWGLLEWAAEKLDFFIAVQFSNWTYRWVSESHWLLECLYWQRHAIHRLFKSRPEADVNDEHDGDLRDQDQFFAANIELPRSPASTHHLAVDEPLDEEPGDAAPEADTNGQVPLPPPLPLNDDHNILLTLFIVVARLGAVIVLSTLPIFKLVAYVLHEQNEPPVRLEVPFNGDAQSQRASPTRPQLHLASSSDARPAKSFKNRPGLVSITASARKESVAQPSPATAWKALEPRLTRYYAMVTEVDEIISNWHALMDSLKPLKAQECKKKSQKLQDMIQMDTVLESAQRTWGSIPVLDTIQASIKRQSDFIADEVSNIREIEEKMSKRRLETGLNDFMREEKTRLHDEDMMRRRMLPKGNSRHEASSPIEIKEAENREVRTKRIRIAEQVVMPGPLVRPSKKTIRVQTPAVRDVSMDDVSTTTARHRIIRSAFQKLTGDTFTFLQKQVGTTTVPYTMEKFQQALDGRLDFPVIKLVDSGQDEIEVLILSAVDLMVEARALAAIGVEDLDVWPLTTIVGRTLTCFHHFISVDARYLLSSFASAVEERKQLAHLNVRSARFSLNNLYQRTLDIQRKATKLRHIPGIKQSVMADLDGLLPRITQFVETLKFDARLLVHKDQCQVAAAPETLQILAQAVSKDLHPSLTSGHNLLCGPRALVASLKALNALPIGVHAEDYLTNMYTDFENLHSSDFLGDDASSELTPEYAAYLQSRLGTDNYTASLDALKKMNNFSIEQLEFMMGYLVTIGLIEDKYQLGYVTEDCEGGPWTATIRNPGDNLERETVWLYSDNAEIRLANWCEWKDWARQMRRTSEWTPELEELDKQYQKPLGGDFAHWSGFGHDSFDKLDVVKHWGLLDDVDDDVKARNLAKKSVKERTYQLVIEWKRTQANARRAAGQGQHQTQNQAGTTTTQGKGKKKAGQSQANALGQVQVQVGTKGKASGGKSSGAQGQAGGQDQAQDPTQHSTQTAAGRETSKKTQSLQPRGPLLYGEENLWDEYCSSPSTSTAPASAEGEDDDTASEAENEEDNRTQCTKPCRFFQAGNCRHGQKCKFAHEVVQDAGDDKEDAKRKTKEEEGNCRKGDGKKEDGKKDDRGKVHGKKSDEKKGEGGKGEGKKSNGKKNYGTKAEVGDTSRKKGVDGGTQSSEKSKRSTKAQEKSEAESQVPRQQPTGSEQVSPSTRTAPACPMDTTQTELDDDEL